MSNSTASSAAVITSETPEAAPVVIRSLKDETESSAPPTAAVDEKSASEPAPEAAPTVIRSLKDEEAVSSAPLTASVDEKSTSEPALEAAPAVIRSLKDEVASTAPPTAEADDKSTSEPAPEATPAVIRSLKDEVDDDKVVTSAPPTAVVDENSTSEPAPEAAPAVIRSLKGEVDVDEAVSSAPPTAANDDNSTSILDVGALSIEEEPKLLDEPEDSNIQAVTAGDTPYTSAKKFEDLDLSQELLKGLYVEMRFERPSKIQAVTLPMILNPPNRNLIAQAHNGSGKTTCFVLGMLSRVDPKLKAPQALCMCPTRELVIQNLEVLTKMGKYTGITVERAVPEGDNEARVTINKRPVITSQVVIGTPGTIKRLMSFRKLSLVHMKILVYDEADHMLAEDGFRDDSLKIMNDIKRSAANCQVLLFSATFNDTVKNFVARTIPDYNQLFVKKEELSLDSVKQFKVQCPDELTKILVIKDKILELGQKVGQTIIFVRTRNSATMLHKALVEFGYEVTTIQGALSQEDRDKIVKEFKDGLTQVLISTDLLARGFDQSHVNLVVNYDLPMKYDPRPRYRSDPEPDCEVYMHRVGRAGRFGRKGAVFNLLCMDTDDKLMAKIEQHFGMQVAEVPSWNSEEAFEDALKEAKLL